MFYMRSVTILALIIRALDLLIPRFIREEVAFGLYGDTEDPDVCEYYPICPVSDITCDDEVYMVGTMRSFNILGVAFFPKLVGNLSPYVDEEEMEG